MSDAGQRVLVVGEVLVDIVERDGGTSEHVGGSPANVAIGLAALDHPTSLAACVGSDERGDRIRAHLVEHDVALTEGSIREGRTSTARAEIGPDGAAAYTFDIDWDPSLGALGPGFGHVHTGSLATVLRPGAAGVLDLVDRLTPGLTLSYDPNIRPAVVGDPAVLVADVERVVGLSTVVKASDEDVALLYPGRTVDDVLEHWSALGAALVVVTLGAEGVRWRAPSGTLAQAPTRAERVIDTVGAGDSFMAGILSGLLDAGVLGTDDARHALAAADDDAVRACIERGLATSALTVARAGAYAPTRSELTTKG